MYSNSQTKRNSRKFFLNHSWTVVAIFFVMVGALLAVNATQVLIPFYILGSVIVGIFLYKSDPIFYLNFVVWMWLICPIIVRLITSKLGYLMPGGNAAAPLVTLITLATLIKNLPRLYREKDPNLIPFFLVLLSVSYGCLITFIRIPFTSVVSALGIALGSLAPIVLAFHIYINWRSYPSFRRSISKNYAWIAIFMGGYGLFQFIFAPQWDTQYMLLSSGEHSSYLGNAEPFGIRIFGTMANTFAYALNLMPALVLLSTLQEKQKLLGMVLGYPALLLTIYRTAWYSWLVAMLTLFISVKPQKQVLLLFSLVGIAIISIIFASMEPFSEIINTRFSSFADLQNDTSGLHRMEQFNTVWDTALKTWDGYGVGSDNYMGVFIKNLDFLSGLDMGVPQILLSLGLVGAFIYFTGLFLLLSKMFLKFPMAKSDFFAAATRAIVLGSVFRIFTSSVLYGDLSLPIWFFMGIGIAGQRYYEELRKE